MIELIERYSNADKQGTPEWKLGRKKTIGGSESHYFYGNRSLICLAESKLDLSSFSGNIHTRRGNVMEPVSRNFTSFIFSAEIYEVGGIEGLRDTDGKLLIKYSPDGLMTVPNDFDITILDKLCAYLNVDYLKICPGDIVLLEYKNPTVRIPGKSIPKNYIPQLLSGLNAAPICGYALFDDTKSSIINFDSFMGTQNITTWYAIYSETPFTINKSIKICGENVSYKMLFIDPCINKSHIEAYDIALVDTKSLKAYHTNRFYGTDSFKMGSNKQKIFKHLSEARDCLGQSVHIIGFVFVEILKKSVIQFYKTEDFPERSAKQMRKFLDTIESLPKDISSFDLSDDLF
jgi:hypothetical protein